MAVSPLATESYPAYEGNYSGPEARKNITDVTVHHMAGVNSAKGCGTIFQRPGRNGSSHYGIGVDGEIAWYVDENCVAWTNSNWPSNQCSVTIETSNSELGGDWPVSDASLASLVKLVADIAKRNGLGKLVPGENLTWHSMFASTSCPGPYLLSKMQYIADEANKINDEVKPTPTPEPTPAPAPNPSGFAVGDKVTLKSYVDYNGTRLINTNNLVKVGGGTPAPAPATIKVGSKVTLVKYVDYNGTPLYKTRDFYFVAELRGDRAVLRADSMYGPIYAAVNVNNLRLV